MAIDHGYYKHLSFKYVAQTDYPPSMESVRAIDHSLKGECLGTYVTLLF